MPFCHFRLRGEKPPNSAYPRELKTWGDHLRKHRWDLGLLQNEAARLMRINPETVSAWERNLQTPYVHHIPAIIDFLGYAPFDPAWTFGERLRAVREALGLSQAGLAKKLGRDEGAVRKWERGKGRPPADLLVRMAGLFGRK